MHRSGSSLFPVEIWEWLRKFGSRSEILGVAAEIWESFRNFGRKNGTGKEFGQGIRHLYAFAGEGKKQLQILRQYAILAEVPR
jgi:hypothetical protein